MSTEPLETQQTGTDVEKLFGKELPTHLDDWFAKHLLKEATRAGVLIRKTAMMKLNKHPTGVLARSFLPPRFLKTTSGDLAAAALSSVPYAGIHNVGGTVRPNEKKWLTIPIAAKARNRKATDFTDAFFVQSRSRDTLFLMRPKSKKKNAKLELLYVLKKSIYLRPTKYIDTANKFLAKETGRNTAVGIGIQIDSLAEKVKHG